MRTINLIKQLRKDRGFTQQDMAKLMGYKSKSAYCMLENGKVKLTIDKAKIIAEILKVDISIFFN